jgi:glycosyltransferase involved in cell wall biosynthesis
MLEAMAAGCLVVAFDTPPVTEVITDGENGLRVDFFSPPQIAEWVLGGLAKKEEHDVIRKEVRNTITTKYALNIGAIKFFSEYGQRIK